MGTITEARVTGESRTLFLLEPYPNLTPAFPSKPAGRRVLAANSAVTQLFGVNSLTTRWPGQHLGVVFGNEEYASYAWQVQWMIEEETDTKAWSLVLLL